MPIGEFEFSGYLEPEEVHAIIAAIPRVSRHPRRDQLLVELLWQSGARITEVLTLLRGKIGGTSVMLVNLKQRKPVTDKNGKTVRNGSGTIVKIRNEDATKEVEISKELCQRLNDFCLEYGISNPNEWVFKGNRNERNRLSRWYVWSMLTKVSEQVGVKRFGKKHSRTGGRYKGAYPHLLRHSNAMFLLDQTDNIDLVREHLGHASVITTQGYARVKKIKMKKTIEGIEW